jgi:hypothetical protein
MGTSRLDDWYGSPPRRTRIFPPVGLAVPDIFGIYSIVHEEDKNGAPWRPCKRTPSNSKNQIELY